MRPRPLISYGIGGSSLACIIHDMVKRASKNCTLLLTSAFPCFVALDPQTLVMVACQHGGPGGPLWNCPSLQRARLTLNASYGVPFPTLILLTKSTCQKYRTLLLSGIAPFPASQAQTHIDCLAWPPSHYQSPPAMPFVYLRVGWR